MKNWKESLKEKNKASSCFERRINLAKMILNKLEQQPLRWTPLLKATIHACGSPPRLYYILKFLEENGFVHRILINGKSHWSIADRGKELLKVLSVDKDSSKMHRFV